MCLPNRCLAAVLLAALAVPPLPAPARPSGALYRFKAETELVLVNVTVRDKAGNAIRNLTRDDFTALEDGKPQHVASFDFEQADLTAVPTPPQQAVLVAPKNAPTAAPPVSAAKLDLRDRR